MNTYKKLLLVGLLTMSSGYADIMQTLGFKSQDASLDVVLGDEKKTELKALQTELAFLQEKEQKYWQEHQAKLDKINADIGLLEQEGKKEETDLLNKKLLTFKTIKQTCSNIKATWKEIISRTKEHISLLEGYIKDPEFASLKLEKKSFYSFDDLQDLNEQIAAQEEKIIAAQSEKNESMLDLSNRKKKLGDQQAELLELTQKQKEFASHTQQRTMPETLDIRHKGEILDAQVMLAQYEKTLGELRVQEEEVDLATIVSKVDIEEKKFSVLKKKRDLMIRMSLRVDEKDIAQSREKLAEKKKEYLNASEEQTQKIEKLSEAIEKQKEKIKEQQKQYESSVDDVTAFTDWTARPGTLEGYAALGAIGQSQEHLSLLDRAADLLRATKELGRAEFTYEEVSADIVQLWYKLKHQQFKSDELAKENKKYQAIVTERERERGVFEDKRKTATSRLNVQNKALSNLKELEEKIKSQRSTLFRGAGEKYILLIQKIETSKELVAKQVEITSKIIEVYSKLLVTVSRSVRKINAMTAELQRVSLWHRSGRAISRQGLQNLLPDIYAFLSDVKTLGVSYFAGFTQNTFWSKAKEIIQSPVSLFFLLLKLLIGVALFMFLRRYLLVWAQKLQGTSKEFFGTYLMSISLAMLLEFIWTYLFGICLWLGFFISFGLSPSLEIPSILFFLLSVPYLLYLSRKFALYVAVFNEKNEHLLFSDSFQARFTTFLSLFLYATVVILLFRKAFVLATYTSSELPDILLALYSIIVRVLLLSLIRKEDLLSLIPSKTPFWAWLWRVVDNYYYPVLFSFIIIMIMMDPHIGGYNNLVHYLVWGIVGSLVVAKGVFELYAFCRRSSSFLFFSSDGETLQERFQFSKTLYGIAVIVLFLTFSFIAVICIAWVWDKPITLDMFSHFLTTERLTITGSAGQLQKLNILDLLKTMAFIPLGFLIAFINDRFILHRIFSVLLVNPGVHNAVSTIVYYVVVISVITVGLWGEGFGFVIAFYIAPILLGMIYALRDVFNDFVSYFVILVQRPLKVGDYIQLDDHVSGVVRNITPRAVVLRKKFGYCIIVPNSRVLRDHIINWDYNLNFIAPPDISVCVRYIYDPEKIKEVLYKAVENNPNVLKTPPPVIRLDSFDDSGFGFMVRIFISPEKTLQQWNIASDTRLEIVKQLRANGMEIAFPVRIIKVEQKKGATDRPFAEDDQ